VNLTNESQLESITGYLVAVWDKVHTDNFSIALTV